MPVSTKAWLVVVRDRSDHCCTFLLCLSVCAFLQAWHQIFCLESRDLGQAADFYRIYPTFETSLSSFPYQPPYAPGCTTTNAMSTTDPPKTLSTTTGAIKIQKTTPLPKPSIRLLLFILKAITDLCTSGTPILMTDFPKTRTIQWHPTPWKSRDA